ncbi:reprolysin (M12B) family zinc metalloprotease domain-containing protein [Phthorimaea operculella]|nr:reprolysin (M12B) family zinc metalloprotease domain-containing protein [Phthorimaea operculella]
MKLSYLKIFVLFALLHSGFSRVTQVTHARRRIRFQRIMKPKEITIDIMIHFDNDMSTKLPEALRTEPKRYLKLLARRILYDAEYILRHLHLKEQFKLNLIDAVYIEKDIKTVAKGENVLKYLKSYCKWQSKNKKGRKRFYSVLFSGIDLVFVNSKGERNKKSTGRSFGGAICSNTHSCTVIEWHRKNSGYLLAHEIAHSLGVAHNGVPFNNCNPSGYVMSSSYSKQKPPVKWSPCSRDAMQEFLESRKSWCLRRT